MVVHWGERLTVDCEVASLYPSFRCKGDYIWAPGCFGLDGPQRVCVCVCGGGLNGGRCKEVATS